MNYELSYSALSLELARAFGNNVIYRAFFPGITLRLQHLNTRPETRDFPNQTYQTETCFLNKTSLRVYESSPIWKITGFLRIRNMCGPLWPVLKFFDRSARCLWLICLRAKCCWIAARRASFWVQVAWLYYRTNDSACVQYTVQWLKNHLVCVPRLMDTTKL